MGRQVVIAFILLVTGPVYPCCGLPQHRDKIRLLQFTVQTLFLSYILMPNLGFTFLKFPIKNLSFMPTQVRLTSISLTRKVNSFKISYTYLMT